MKPFAVVVVFLMIFGIGASLHAQTTQNIVGPIYYAGAYGVPDDDTNDACPTLGHNDSTGLIGTVAGKGGGVIQLSTTGWTLMLTCDLVLPPHVIIRGGGAYGQNENVSPINSGLHMVNAATYAHVMCLDYGGQCGLENITIWDDMTSSLMFLDTCAVPYLNNVSFYGKTSAVGGTPVNDAVSFGGAGSGVHGGIGTAGSDGFCGYGNNVIHNLYFSNIRRMLWLRTNANDLKIHDLWGDYTDGYTGGYAVEIGSTSPSTNPSYGNEITGFGLEQAVNGGGGPCNYKGAFGLTAYAQGNLIIYEDNDVAPCLYTGYITNDWGTAMDSHSIRNYIIAMSQSGVTGQVSDVNSGSVANTIVDMPGKSISTLNLTAVHIGTSAVPTNDIVFGAYSITSPPASATYKEAWFNNSYDGTCTYDGVHTGSLKVKCFYNGSSWVPLGNLSSPTFQSPNIGAATGISLTASTFISGATYKTATNCVQVGTAANPSVVSCSSASAGIVYCDSAASGTTCRVNTSAVTANSEIFITPNAADGTVLSKTCSTALSFGTAPILAAKAAATSFTINMPVTGINGACFEYHIVN